jgi:DNA-binding transcriptional LysR family regulator
MELRYLRYFVAAADELSFTGAAAKLHLTQPSLTRQIRNLEAELCVELFSREKKRISLTAQGEFFLERTRRLLAQSASDVDAVRRRVSGTASLRVGYAADLHYDLLPGALSDLRRIWPEVALNLFDLTISEQLLAFQKDKLDLSFVREAKLPAGARLQREQIHDCDVVVVIPETDTPADTRPMPLAELKEQPFVVLSEELYPGVRGWLKRVCRGAGFVPKIRTEVDRAPTLLCSVALGQGIALLPEGCRKLPHEGVTFRPVAETVKSRTEIVWKRTSLSQPLRQYAQLVRRRFQ